MEVWSPLFFAVLVASISTARSAMTMQAFKQSKGMMVGVCQPRTGVSKELLAELSKGQFPEADDRKLKCYFECILRMGNVMKGSQVSGDALRRLARTMLPTQLRPLVMPSIDACEHVADEGDACSNAYAFVKCHHQNTGPEGFMFA